MMEFLQQYWLLQSSFVAVCIIKLYRKMMQILYIISQLNVNPALCLHISIFSFYDQAC